MKRARTWTLALLVAGVTAPLLACPANADLTVRDLLGAWRADIAGTWLPADLVLEPNPDWPGSLAGHVRRADRLARLAGDLEDGTFTLEESADGVRIDATWVGQPVEGRCGREIRGTWQPAGDSIRRAFTLRRVGGDRRGF